MRGSEVKLRGIRRRTKTQCWNSPQKTNMCWGPNVSFLSWAAGIIVCVVACNLVPRRPLKLVCVVWVFVLFMQLAEGCIWLDPACGSVNQIASRWALVFNLMQPVAGYMIYVCFDSELSRRRRAAASVVVFAYLAYMLPRLYEACPEDPWCTIPASGCAHLDLSYWSHVSGTVFSVCLFALIMILVRPLGFAAVVAGTAFSALALSRFFCGAESLWCWLVVPAPLLFALALSPLP